ncbi:cobalt-precorrin-8X methylmutase [Nodosilinea sp. FACHB-131]|uniref:cobalt-precorrin-8X methylmutase n=1 Tax=Cyanophyceae TaxID=3028117 RepID=UPI00168852DC|nr:cobalt-precorrin-8X methylmutase [Nodosilinea sp. FACHB-131]MBD1876616.1 cobalt-precorrin-8X methylmutase [Nodosilinea sp. FACHB-131]
MVQLWQSPILEESFALIDREVGEHGFAPAEYAVVRRVIHSTADFEFKELVRFSEEAIATATQHLSKGGPIIVDVTMVRQGVVSMVERTFQNPLLTAVMAGDPPEEGRTRTETGLLRCLEEYPNALVVIGNAPTALMALCDRIATAQAHPALVIGAPVGFVAVEASKQRLAQTSVPQIRVEGRKGGSPVAAAILNALLVLAWEQRP